MSDDARPRELRPTQLYLLQEVARLGRLGRSVDLPELRQGARVTMSEIVVEGDDYLARADDDEEGEP